MTGYKSSLLLTLSLLLAAARPLIAAETVDQLIAGAKKESEFTFIAGAQTFGGTKNLSVLEAAFNKRFGLNARIRFAAGPEMNAMAARVITEMKSGNPISPSVAAQRESAGTGQLVWGFSLDHKADGNFS